MEREQYQQVAIVAGALAVIVALMSGRLPRWLRIVLVFSLGILGAGAGLFGYRYLTQPTTLTIATGSLDGDVPRIMSAIAARMASTNAPVRLKVVEKATAQEAAKEFAGIGPIGHQPTTLRELAPSGDHRYPLILRKLGQTPPLQHDEVIGDGNDALRLAVAHRAKRRIKLRKRSHLKVAKNFDAALATCRQYLSKYPNHALFQALKFDVEERRRHNLSAVIAETDRRVEQEQCEGGGHERQP
jgi:uncharacterized membrane protein